MADTDKLIIKKWILGSSSKWRREVFLKEFQSDLFAVADIDEKAIRHPKAEIMTQIIAKAKADEIIRRGEVELKDNLLVCCDQVIRFRGEIREKPESRDECRAFLRSYAEHPDEFVECINGICVYFNGQFLSHYEISKLTFSGLTDAKIDELVQLDDLMTCAGGFTVCHMDIGRLQGSVYGIEGLPVHMVRQLGTVCANVQVHGAVTHCIFNVDVLVNIHELCIKAHEEVWKICGGELPEDLKTRLFGLVDENALQTMVDTLTRTLDITSSAYLEVYLEEFYSVIEPMLSSLKYLPAAESLLNQLKVANVAKYVVSRQPRVLFDSMSRTSIGKQVLEFFGNNIVCSADIPDKSTNLEIYQAAMDKFRNTDTESVVKNERVAIFEGIPVYTSDFSRAGMNVIILRNSNQQRDGLGPECCLEMNSFVDFDFTQLVN